MAGQRPLELAELIDLELQFAADREADKQMLRERDERIGRTLTLEVDPGARHEIFRRWLAALREGDAPSAGERVEALYRWIGVALALLAFLTGAGTARAVLAYDGTHPVNLIHFLAVFVAAQVALLAVWVATMIPAARAAGRRAYTPVHELLREIVYRRSSIAPARAISTRVGPWLGRLGALGSIYGAAERWRIMALMQRTAFFFNVGALVTCFYLIAFTDLAFAWSTTLEVSSATMAKYLRGIAWPWRWLPAAVPSDELVAASRYFRMSKGYDPSALKDWWAFLLAALTTYGLMPRLLLWQFAARRSCTIRRQLALDHGDCQVAYERLTRCLHGWCGPGARELSDGHDERAGDSTSHAPVLGAAADCTVLTWADVPLSTHEAARLVETTFGWRAAAVYACGGREMAGDLSAVLADVGRDPRERPLVILAEAWEAPSRAVTHFLSALRNATGARRTFVIGLLGTHDGGWSAPDPDDHAVWERGAASLGDPYLRVEAMVPQ